MLRISFSTVMNLLKNKTLLLAPGPAWRALSHGATLTPAGQKEELRAHVS